MKKQNVLPNEDQITTESANIIATLDIENFLSSDARSMNAIDAIVDIESDILLHQIQRREPIKAINTISNIIQSYLNEPKLSNELIVNRLQKIDQSYYKHLVNDLAYKHEVWDISKLITLFEELGYLSTLIGDYSIQPYKNPLPDLSITPLTPRINKIIYDYLIETSPLKYYSDAAIFYQYALNIYRGNLSSVFASQFPKQEKDNLNDVKEIFKIIYEYLSPQYQELQILQDKIWSFAKATTTENVQTQSMNNRKILRDLRENVQNKLKILESNKDKSIYAEQSEKLFVEITSTMKTFLAKLCQEAQFELGIELPCEYSVIGLGSMALNQMTPYSDLEFAIITQNNDYKNDSTTKDYFRDLSHLVHFKVINLGETPIPTNRYNIDTNYLIHVGVNFDLGGKTPLGRVDQDKPYDLIGTQGNLLWYVKNEQSKAEHIDKNLPYILENACYVYGNENLVKEYKDQVKSFLKRDYLGQEEQYRVLKNHQVRSLKILEQGAVELDYSRSSLPSQLNPKNLRGDLGKLSPVFDNENEGKLFDVKTEIYRLPDRMIYNLGMHFGVIGVSAWDTVDQLLTEGIINQQGANNLKEAISFATTLRLKTYANNEGQRDNMSTYSFAIEHLDPIAKQQLKLQTFYIQDTKPLHKFYYTMLRVLGIGKALCNPESRKVTEVALKDDPLYELTNYNKARIHARILEYEAAVDHMEKALKEEPSEPIIKDYLLNLYLKLNQLEKAIKFGKKNLKELQNMSQSNQIDVAYGFNNMGIVYSEKGI